MKRIAYFFGICSLIMLFNASCVHCIDIKPNGNTTVDYRSNKVNIKAVLKTTMINTPQSLKIYYDVAAVSVVETLIIKYNDKDIFVPRSVFADLYDIKTASIITDKNKYILTITGADASEAFVVKIYFDNQKVYRRTLLDRESNTITQDAKYKLIAN